MDGLPGFSGNIRAGLPDSSPTSRAPAGPGALRPGVCAPPAGGGWAFEPGPAAALRPPRRQLVSTLAGGPA